MHIFDRGRGEYFMKKMIMLLMVILLLFVGCTDTEESSLVERNQNMEDMNGDDEGTIEIPNKGNEVVKESSEKEVHTLSSNKKVYENENIVIYKNLTDTDYKDIIDSPYDDMNAIIKWNLSNYYYEDNYGEVSINDHENQITTITKTDINNSIVWLNNSVLLIEGHILYNTETKEQVEMYSDNETNQVLDYSINPITKQSVLLVKNNLSLNIIHIDIDEQSELNTFNFSIPEEATEVIKYEIAYVDDTDVLFNGYDDSSYPSIIKLNLISGESEKYSSDLTIESEYFTKEKHVIVFNDARKLLVLNINNNDSIEDAVPIISNRWYLREEGIIYIYNNICYELFYNTGENRELFDLKELNMDSEKYNSALEFCMRHHNIGIFYQPDGNEDSEEDYLNINGTNYILEIR